MATDSGVQLFAGHGFEPKLNIVDGVPDQMASYIL
jgi:hypothetical protein